MSNTHAPRGDRYTIVLAGSPIHAGAVSVAQKNAANDSWTGIGIDSGSLLRNRGQESVQLRLLRDNVSIT